MEMHKERIKKEDGRYLIYYTFNEDKQNKIAKQEKKIAAKIENNNKGGECPCQN